MIALTGIPVIETPRLILRGPKSSDFEGFAAFTASDRSIHVGGPLSRVMAWRGFCHATGHWLHRGYSSFIIVDKVTDLPLGMSGPWFPEGWPEPEIAWTIWVPEAEGKGMAFEAAQAARAWAYHTLGWTTAISMIAAENARSQALARRMGCTRGADFSHETFGACQIWRHPSAESLK